MRPRQSTHIYQKRVNRVIDYIKDHLTEPLPIGKLARLAHFSPFHFHRIFRAIVGEPLHACVIRLRLEKAIQLILYGPSATLTEVALASGFASSSDFSRAFKQAYGFSPRHCSRERLLEDSKIRQDLFANAGYGFGKLPAGNPDRFRVRLLDRPVQLVAYVRVIGAFSRDKVRAGFDRLMNWGRRRALLPGATLIGMSRDHPESTPMQKYQLDWCLVVPPGLDRGDEVSFAEIPANRFAVVRSAGDVHKEGRAWRHLYQSWLPASGYQPTNDPSMGVYRRTPLELDWERYDLDCCLPVRRLRADRWSRRP
jgi:AraC family transcriptional regulator